MLKTVFSGIERARAQSEHLACCMKCAGESWRHIPQHHQHPAARIMVNGEQEYLSRPDIVNKIRACLLTGIRSAILWKRCGGTRWKFLFFRKKIQAELQNLLQQL